MPTYRLPPTSRTKTAASDAAAARVHAYQRSRRTTLAGRCDQPRAEREVTRWLELGQTSQQRHDRLQLAQASRARRTGVQVRARDALLVGWQLCIQQRREDIV